MKTNLSPPSSNFFSNILNNDQMPQSWNRFQTRFLLTLTFKQNFNYDFRDGTSFMPCPITIWAGVLNRGAHPWVPWNGLSGAGNFWTWRLYTSKMRQKVPPNFSTTKEECREPKKVENHWSRETSNYPSYLVLNATLSYAQDNHDNLWAKKYPCFEIEQFLSRLNPIN